jgi:hypothetical protein
MAVRPTLTHAETILLINSLESMAEVIRHDAESVNPTKAEAVLTAEAEACEALSSLLHSELISDGGKL